MKLPHAPVFLFFAAAVGAAQELSLSALPAGGPVNPTASNLHSNLFWADYDGDGLLDAFAVDANGAGRLLRNTGRASFEDVTQRTGLAETAGAHMAAWADVSGDGLPDLYLASYSGVSRLFVQTPQGTFADTTEASGLPQHAEPIHADWFDFDADGSLDLHLVTVYDELVYRNTGRAQFAKIDLGPITRSPIASAPRPDSIDDARAMNGLAPHGPTTSQPAAVCGPPAIMDMAAPMSCLNASSTPTLGMLYPLSIDLNVSPAGNVGVGLAGAGQKLDVAGNARAQRFISTAGGGTAPFVVNSSTVVGSLNADLLDGFDSSDFRPAGVLIGLGDLAANSVDSSKVVDNSLTSNDLGTNSVGSSEIAANAVGSSEIAANAVGNSEMDDDSIGSFEVIDNSLIQADLAPNSVGVSELAANSIQSVDIIDGAIINADVSNNAAIEGTKIDPDFGSQDLVTNGNGTFGAGGLDNWQVKGQSANGPTNGYVAVQGATDYDGTLSADWLGFEVGIAGVSTGASTTDNFGVLGHSNNAGVRGEHATSPGTDWAELGKAGVGIEASGTTNAGVFNGDVDINGELTVTDSTAANTILLINTSAGTVARTVELRRTEASSSGNDILEIEAATGSSIGGQLIEAQVGADVKFRADVDGDVFCDGAFFGGGADYAEMIEVSTGATSVAAGDLMEIDPTGNRQIRISSQPYSRLVAGIYSTEPGFIGSERDWDGLTNADGETAALKMQDALADDEIPLAIVGIVPCKVTNENGAIRAGDLLVTSSTPGHAMVDNNPPIGTVIGKALESFSGANGTIKVLVTLQ